MCVETCLQGTCAGKQVLGVLGEDHLPRGRVGGMGDVRAHQPGAADGSHVRWRATALQSAAGVEWKLRASSRAVPHWLRDAFRLVLSVQMGPSEATSAQDAVKSSMSFTMGSGLAAAPFCRSYGERSMPPVVLLTGSPATSMYHSLLLGSVPVEMLTTTYLQTPAAGRSSGSVLQQLQGGQPRSTWDARLCYACRASR